MKARIKYFLLAVCLLPVLQAQASVDIRNCMQSRGRLQLCSRECNDICLVMPAIMDASWHLLSLSPGYGKEWISVTCIYDDTPAHTPFIALGYGPFINSSAYYGFAPVPALGLHLVLSGPNRPDTRRIIRLLHAGLQHKEDIIRMQSVFPASAYRVYGSGAFVPIPYEQVLQFLAEPDTQLARLIPERIYPVDCLDTAAIGYYLQDNRFHFYRRRAQEDDSLRQIGKDVLTASDFYEVAGDEARGYFLFINDSSFCYLPPDADTAQSPVVIRGMPGYRWPLTDYEYRTYPAPHFILTLRNNGNEDKALFFPKENLLLSDFCRWERNMIRYYLKQHKAKPVKRDDKAIAFFIASVSILLNVFLLLRRRK